MYNFDKIVSLNKKFDEILTKDFGHFRPIAIVQKDSESDKDVNYLTLFMIEKGEKSLFGKPTSHDDFESQKKKFLDEVDSFAEKFDDFLDRVEKQLSESEIESLEIIGKTIDNRTRKLISAVKKFKIDENWNLQKLSDEYLIAIDKNFSSFISEVVRVLESGIDEKPFYQQVLQIFNSFLKNIGIFTLELKAGEKLDDKKYDFIQPEECDKCNTTDRNLAHVIKNVISFPYMVAENRAIADGKVNMWRIVNG
ncbi:hypothetical protein ThvES_00002930 [Thiovulum sp. ES]|nr:hypothetical protein ThvES_00002930 [Thiovulum sp. ES]